jgi:hypothetical protein
LRPSWVSGIIHPSAGGKEKKVDYMLLEGKPAN